jgi:predicted membrane metal-binding protein
MVMGPVNWITVVVAGLVAVALGRAWYRLLGLRAPAVWRLAALLVPAAMMGHNFARVGAETLAAKPWLYPMMSGGFALAIVLPAGFALYGRHGVKPREAGADAGFVLVAFLAMGAVFWGLA